jgi:predicted MFS family arabinose efflux permease
LSLDGDRLAPTRRALLLGNFAIGCGVMVVAGSLNDLTRSLAVSVAAGGQLITVAAIVMAAGAPLAAAVVAGFDRRRLLTLALAWYALGHLLCALMPGYWSLLVVRAATVLSAAVFTPQAAAAIGVMARPEERGRSITFVFLGWSVASVIGMPLHAYVGEAFGWRWAFALVGAIAAVGAVAVWRAMPDGVKPAALSLANWGQIVTSPVLLVLVAVTALSGAGQFTVFSYFAPYYRQVLGASPAEVSFLFLWFGLFGLIGNLLLTRLIDRVGTSRAVTGTLALMMLSLLAWPLAGSVAAMAAVLLPWGLGCFASNSAQQARTGLAEPRLAPAMIALNTSAIYLGQAIGAAGGGALVAAGGYAPLSWVGVLWMLAAIAASVWVGRQLDRRVAHGH